jgi:thiamine biosynthesis lipoprotein
MAADSRGAFDPTVAPLVRLWHFGPRAQAGGVPTAEEIVRVRQSIGFRLIDVRLDPPALRKTDPRVELDLNAIAPGFAVDRIAEHLEQRGVPGYMVEIGGEIRTRGAKPDGQPWRVGIEQPVEGMRLVHRALSLTDAALATSGDYRNFFVRDGVRYSHTIDPHSGRPVTHHLASVTVVADDCTTADGLATTLTVLGPAAGREFAAERGIAAYFLVRRDDGFDALATPAFTARFGTVAAAGATSWTTFLLAAVVFGAVVFGLIAATVLGRRQIRGSCGGLAGLRDEHGNPLCEACRNPAEECDEFRQRMSAERETAGGNRDQPVETDDVDRAPAER